LAKTYASCDLVEEYIGGKVFPVRTGWFVVAWNDFSSPIKIPEFARSFGLTKDGTCLFFLCCFLLNLAYHFSFYFAFILLIVSFFIFFFAAINVAEIEPQASEILGPISSKKDAEIQEHLGGTRDNRLLFLFNIHVGDRAVTIGHREAQAKCVAKKGRQGSSEAAAPSAR
jgi:hypothetical protein